VLPNDAREKRFAIGGRLQRATSTSRPPLSLGRPDQVPGVLIAVQCAPPSVVR
jgi:hypothetical protein